MKYGIGKEEFFTTPRLVNLIKKFSKGKCLDAGCGTGAYFPYFNSSILYGIDSTAGYLTKIKSKKNTEKKLILRKADVRKLPYPNSFFDFVFSAAVLEYMKNEKELLKAVTELKRVLKKRGILVVSVPNKSIFSSFFRKKMLSKVIVSNKGRDPYFIMGKTISQKKLKQLGFSTFGCLGWVTWRNLKNNLASIFFDTIFWHLPFLSGTLIGVYKK